MNLAQTLNLDAPIVVFDVETTGTSYIRDSIVQLALIKVYPDGTQTEWETLLNPGRKITNSDIHGITDEMVTGKPVFKDITSIIINGFNGCYLAGYNVKFDIRMLEAELAKVGALSQFKPGLVLDAFRIYTHYHPRTLTAAVFQYLGEEFPDAHDAKHDVRATLRVLEKQFKEHIDLPRDMGELHELLFEKGNEDRLDPDGKIVWINNEACLNFGEHNGVPLRQVSARYLKWMMNKDFSRQVKEIVSKAIAGDYPSK